MKQTLFGSLNNTGIMVQLVLATVTLAGIGWLAYNFFTNWPSTSGVGEYVAQPIPFSHRHHVGHIRIDCGYCHTSTGTSSFAGIPATHTCMTCHSQIWKTSPVLAPVRESYRTGKPIIWQRVHTLPDFAYFSHEPHISSGINCTSCHGQVQDMTTIWKVRPLNMRDCLSCHKSQQRLTQCYRCHR